MRLRMEPSDRQAYSDALPKLDAPSVEYASRRRLHGLPDHRRNHEGPQGGSENDDGNGAFRAVQSGKSTHSLTCGHREQIWYIVSALPFRLRVAAA